MKLLKFLIFLIIAFTVFNIIFNIYDLKIEEIRMDILLLLALGVFGSGIVVLGRMYQKNFPEDENKL